MVKIKKVSVSNKESFERCNRIEISLINYNTKENSYFKNEHKNSKTPQLLKKKTPKHKYSNN